MLILFFFSYFSEASSEHIQYCWSGTEDDPSKWMNLSCSTNLSTLPNLASAKSLPLGETTNQTSHEALLPQRKYYCMAFQYNETTENKIDGSIMTQFKADYSCDTENLCDGKSMYEGYRVSNLYLAKFLKRNNPPSIFVTVHYHLRDIKMRS